MTKPPETRGEDNPWPEYPVVYKLDYGQEEASAIQGEDPRKYQMLTKRIEGDKDGNVTKITVAEVNWLSKNNQLLPVEVPGSEQHIEADLILLAMGFIGAEKQTFTGSSLNFTHQGVVDASYGKFETNLPGVFAAGDCRRGQSLVVWAINEGRAVAEKCDIFLRG